MDVIVLREPARDVVGNIGAGTTHTLSGCAVAPAGGVGRLAASGDLNARASDTTRESLEIYCDDVDADVLATDRIRIGDATYDVDGQPQRWAEAGCVIAISRSLG